MPYACSIIAGRFGIETLLVHAISLVDVTMHGATLCKEPVKETSVPVVGQND